MTTKINVGDVAPGWGNIPDKAELFTFDNNVEQRKQWVVLLTFLKNEKESYGTGFFVNFPNPEYSVILTAGHNLLGSTNVVAHISNPPGQYLEIAVDDDCIKISEEYKKNPDDPSKIHDYGAILLKKSGSKGYPGFGYNIRFASQGLGEKEDAWDSLQGKVVVQGNASVQLYITGYNAKIQGSAIDRQGTLIVTPDNKRLRPDQLEYSVQTAEGFSGSPVWRVDKSRECIVAIHNNGPRSPSRGNRGTRLNYRVLSEIYAWIGVGYMSKALKVHDPKDEKEMFVEFPPNTTEAWLGIGLPSTTKFDVLPAYAPPGEQEDAGLGLYAFRTTSSAGAEKWLVWKGKQNRIGLSNTITGNCFVSLRPHESTISDESNRLFQIVLKLEKGRDQPKDQLLELRIDVDPYEIQECDIELARQERRQAQFQNVVCFERFRPRKEREYNFFSLR